MKKKIVALLMVCSLVIGIFVGGAFADSVNEKISALLNKTIKINYNGETQTFKDANDVVVYPISYNGTTYLPVRAVSGLVGLPVAWDGATNTVMLGSVNKQDNVSLFDRNHEGPERGSQNYKIIDTDELKFEGSDAMQEFDNGLIYETKYDPDYEDLIIYDVSGFDSLSFTLGAKKNDAKLFVFNQDKEVIGKIEIKKDQLLSKTIKLHGATKIGLGADCHSLANSAKVFIYEPVLKLAE